MKPLAEQTLYEILEVPSDAPRAIVEEAWARVHALYGPGSLATYTLMAPDEAALLGARIEEARTILLDTAARYAYDARLSETPAPRAARAERGASRRLPPIIPPRQEPKESVPPAEAADARAETPAAGATETPTATEPPTATPETATSETAAATPTPAATPIAIPPPPPLLPIPLLTPVPISPPFAALDLAPAPAVTRREEPAPCAAPALTPAPTPGARDVEPARPVAPPGREAPIPEAARYTGEALRRAREARGISIVQMCERTKIVRGHLENVEADRYERLPAPVYVRGILMALAKELRLDGQRVARSYLETAAGALGSKGKVPVR